MQEKIKVMKKNKFRIRRILFYCAKVTSIRKSPQITHRTHGDSSQSPYPYHTHTHGNPHGNPHTHGSPDYRQTAQHIAKSCIEPYKHKSQRISTTFHASYRLSSTWQHKPLNTACTL